MTLRQTTVELLNELAGAELKERADWTRIVAAALLAELPTAKDRSETIDYLNWCYRQTLS
jgi:hypothetical protein